MARAKLTRRNWLLAGSAGVATARQICGRAASRPFHVGVPDWNLHQDARTEALPMAARLGFEGVQISFGREIQAGRLPVDRPEVLAEYLRLSREHKVVIDGTCVDRLHDNGLISDPLAGRWVSDAIRLTAALKTEVLLVPFFGRWAITNGSEMGRVGDAIRELAPEAEKAGVMLGLENTISAEDNVRIIDRARSRNVRVYYDVGNSTKAGFDPATEIRWLGRDRICQVHLKDNPHLLGQGAIQFGPIVHALRDIGYDHWANLETDVPRGREDADLRRNLDFIHGVMGQAYPS